MFYYMPNAHRESLLITLIVYIADRYMILHSFTRKLSLCHLHLDFNVRKKRKVRNILIINILYINIYFFCYQFMNK